MKPTTLQVELGDRGYPIHIGAGLLTQSALYAPHLTGRIALVTNDVVAPLYADRLLASLGPAGSDAIRVILPDGEARKDWSSLERIYAALLAESADRKTVVIALGGGVVGDVAGFAAATYQRGIACIQVPTTLLAQVDSSVGGKTAINHPLGKNMIGAFHQPRVVIADTATLATLPPREFAAGLAEVAKHGAIRDLEFLAWIEANVAALVARDPVALEHAIRRSCEIKAAIVAQDERETGVRALLNFGHTFGHAIESALGHGTWLHGEAVAAGMVLAARLSARIGRIAEADVQRLEHLLAALGLPVKAPAITPERWMEFMGRDKKNQGGRITFVLLDALGRASVVRDAPDSALREVLAAA
ncbi:3-dehydroquinate synthase [Usitatibacter palustris]|uniref:3-dehydroquinate synthase n=1 Tax=Usitatibacter palustris TaxID=2732487 RepID=A0A6M4H2D8_9PROT|nr:3-dehydroquinate synthase [Usitatibacter palustris]QJR13238.1 3-dehydroquinate synthase [Usitatibacter palustris]